jgi:hypothetical protein
MGIRNLEGYVRQPEALREADLPLLLDQDGPIEVVLFRVSGDKTVRRRRLREHALGQQQRDDQRQKKFHKVLIRSSRPMGWPPGHHG